MCSYKKCTNPEPYPACLYSHSWLHLTKAVCILLSVSLCVGMAFEHLFFNAPCIWNSTEILFVEEIWISKMENQDHIIIFYFYFFPIIFGTTIIWLSIQYTCMFFCTCGTVLPRYNTMVGVHGPRPHHTWTAVLILMHVTVYVCFFFFLQITLIFLQNMNLLLSKTPQADIRNHVLPMVYRSLESNTPQIQVSSIYKPGILVINMRLDFGYWLFSSRSSA